VSSVEGGSGGVSPIGGFDGGHFERVGQLSGGLAYGEQDERCGKRRSHVFCDECELETVEENLGKTVSLQ
jgi:hypothetical protein